MDANTLGLLSLFVNLMGTKLKYYRNNCQSFETAWSAFSFCCEITSFFSVFLNFLEIDGVCKKMEQWRENSEMSLHTSETGSFTDTSVIGYEPEQTKARLLIIMAIIIMLHLEFVD